MKVTDLLNPMWKDYCDLNPKAKKIFEMFQAEGEIVLNDHIALRTFRHPKLGIESMAQIFKKLGYIEKQDYHFKVKKLYAKHYEHEGDPRQPKIFISELILDQFSSELQSVINSIVDQIPEEKIRSPEFSYSGRSWDLSYNQFEKLSSESEYAGWVASIGFRPNHFTVFVNEMKKFNTIQKVNEFLESRGYILNSSGGKIKGNAEEFLEQSSTMAETVSVQFDEGQFKVPGCYYEFAKRYPQNNGKLYQGFVAASADKIFESTNRTM